MVGVSHHRLRTTQSHSPLTTQTWTGSDSKTDIDSRPHRLANTLFTLLVTVFITQTNYPVDNPCFVYHFYNYWSCKNSSNPILVEEKAIHSPQLVSHFTFWCAI